MKQRAFVNNPSPRDRMARERSFLFWTERPNVPVDKYTCTDNVYANSIFEAANAVFNMLEPLDYEPDVPVLIWIQAADSAARPVCWGATPCDTGDFYELRAYPQEDL